MRIKKQKAFTVAELLIALAISAMLLAAVAVAFNASAKNYQVNEEIFQTMNSARQSLLRITAHLRTADWVDPNSPANECTLVTATGQDITYRYDSDAKKLYLVTNYDLSDSNYVLCDNVSAMNFSKSTGVEDTVVYVKSVWISITVGDNDTHQTVTSAAVIRKNLK